MVRRAESTDEASVLLGRDALRRGAWEEARDHFAAAVEVQRSPAALEGLGLATWWLDDAETTFSAREEAYRLYRAADDPVGAARLATWLAWDYLAFRGEPAVANGWLQRAARLLDGVGVCAEQGWLALRKGEISLLHHHDATAATTLAEYAVEVGRQLSDLDIEMVGLALRGLALVSQGDIAGGMACLDEATAAAVAGELTNLNAVGASCCYLIFACEQVRDYDRAAQWCDRVKEFCRTWRIRPLFAVCRTHYAAVLMSRGRWPEAEAELVDATKELEQTRPAMVIEGLVRLGELRRRQGRSEESKALLDPVSFHPAAQLTLAEIALDEGDAAEALSLSQSVLELIPGSTRTERSLALEIIVRAAAEAGDVTRAKAAARELDALARDISTAPLQAASALAHGVEACASGDLARAERDVRTAVAGFERSSMPYEAAKARRVLADVLRKLGREESARRETTKSDDALRTLGAASYAEADAPSSGRDVDDGVLTSREIEVLALVAAGESNSEIASGLMISEHTVHRHVGNILTKLGVRSRAAAVAEAARRNLL